MSSAATSPTDLWTFFAPTDQAFDYIEDFVHQLDQAILVDILKYHTFPGDELSSDDLVCESKLVMGNGQASLTSCSSSSGYVYQEGPGNASPQMPRIIESDKPACNGVVHVVNHVMLPEF